MAFSDNAVRDTASERACERAKRDKRVGVGPHAN